MEDGSLFEWSICEKLCAKIFLTVLVKTHTEVLENCHFQVFAILVTTTNGHLGLASRINKKGFVYNLQIILIESD